MLSSLNRHLRPAQAALLPIRARAQDKASTTRITNQILCAVGRIEGAARCADFVRVQLSLTVPSSTMTMTNTGSCNLANLPNLPLSSFPSRDSGDPATSTHSHLAPLNICEICPLSPRPKNRARSDTVGSITATQAPNIHLGSYNWMLRSHFTKSVLRSGVEVME
jgi:hypothetical protein